MATAAGIKQFETVYNGTITGDVYVNQGGITRKIASPGDAVEVGDLTLGRSTLCRLGEHLYWIENGSWSVE